MERPAGRYLLCGHCIVRQGSPDGLFQEVPGRRCFVCGGALDRAGMMARLAARRLRPYEFKTFAVGVLLPEGVQEREDEVRSDLKLKGSETVKTQAGKMVSAILSDETGKGVDRMKPDATVLVDFGRRRVEVSTRPLFYYARYAKPAGVSQKRERCRRCSGSGCGRCRKTGYERGPSVELELRRKLRDYTGSENVTLTWLGSEDIQSRVYPPGRPFIAEVKSPVRRRIPRKFGARFRGGQVRISQGKTLAGKPLKLPKFRFVAKIAGVASAKMGKEAGAVLSRAFRGTEVRFQRPHDASVMKTVYRVRGRPRGKSLSLEAELDGGLPVKRFVTGEGVSPSIAEVLDVELAVKRFDIMKVTQVGEFGFA